MTQGIDTDRADPAGRFLLHILAAVAEFEAELIRERVTAGIQAAKRPVLDVSIYKSPPHLLPDHSAAEVRKLCEEAWLTIESAAGLATGCRSECRFGLDRP